MSQVAPNGVIRLFKDVPLDLNHEDTITFATKSAQQSYFLGLTPLHVMQNSTRVRDGVISLNVGEDAIREANYMMFQNLNFADKWFYAYVLRTEYINNNMTYVYYKIDSMQTYGFDIDFKECFIERETTATDGMFEHLVDEGIRVSEYVTNNRPNFEVDMGVMDVVIFSGSDYVNSGTQEDPNYQPTISPCFPYQGFINGLTPRIFHVMNDEGYWDDAEINRMSEWLTHMVELQQSDAIVGAIMFPRNMIAKGSTAMKYPLEPTEGYIDKFNNASSLDGYTPRNKKLYNSPFCLNILGCTDGQILQLQPEYLGDTAEVKVYSNLSMTPSVMALVTNYKGKSTNYEASISFDAFPQVCLSLDGYKAWVASGGLARTALNTSVSAFKDVVNIGTGIVNVASGQASFVADAQFGTHKGGIDSAQSQGATGVGQIANGVANLASDIGNAIITMDVAKTLPPNVKGTTNTSVLMNYLMLRFYTEQRTINADVAKSIDKYFTMYGYKVNTVKKPNLRNRSRFTYVKTKGCVVTGGAPTEVITEIENIMNRGCRFWQDPSDLGNYDDPNLPLGNQA